jgi:predicted glutamine amidotransferase
MCRFLMIKSERPIPAASLLERFAQMAEKSRAPDGDRQGDGWGISWVDEKSVWQTKKSIKPIWTEASVFSQIPDSHLFLVHARSSSFPQHKNVIDFNQPFIEDPYGFVFNGLVRGISLPVLPGGGIGSQKIWYLLKGLLRHSEPKKSLVTLKDILARNSRVIQAFNIGLSDKKHIFAYCWYSENPDYYNLQFHDSPSIKILSSERLEGYDFSPVERNSVIAF